MIFSVLVAINANGLYVIDPLNVVILLGLKLEELSWDYAKPSQENNEDCLPCLFIQFCVIENGRRVSKILQIFSRQASQMDALINTFVDELKQRVAMYNEDHEFGDSSLPDADGKLYSGTSSHKISNYCMPKRYSALVTVWESTEPRLWSKLPLFKTSFHNIALLAHIYHIK